MSTISKLMKTQIQESAKASLDYITYPTTEYMKLSELFEAEQPKKGTYAAVKFSKECVDRIAEFCKGNRINNALKAEKLHTTLLYSRKFLPNYVAQGNIDPPYIGTPVDFELWKTRSEDPNKKPSNCLVLKYRCKALSDRHNFLMKEHGATFDFDNYTCHVTLSYNVGDDFDLSQVKDKIKDIGDIEIVTEYSEDLDLDWASKA